MSGHLDGPPPGPPDPPYIPGDLGAPSAEEFARRRRAALPDERLREALTRANDDLILIADYSPSEVADAIDSVRAAIKDALADGDAPTDCTCGEFCSGCGGRRAVAPDEGWSPGIDDPEPPALGDIDTGEGWYQT